MSPFDHIRQLAVTRWMRGIAMAVLVMCSVTWVAQAVSSAQGGDVVVVSIAAADGAAEPPLPEPIPVDCQTEAECESESESVPLVALDETHDVKLFFLREFTHLFQPVVGRMARNRDLAAILRRSSETFRPPDRRAGRSGRSIAA